MGRTHLLLGLGSLWLLEPLPGAAAHLPAVLLASGFGALLPDLDAPTSLLQTVSIGGVRPFYVPARAVSPYGHRGLLHSLAGVALVASLALPLLAWDAYAWVALLLGYGSHLWADAATRSGIRLLYPDPRRFHSLPRRLRLVTGSPAEEAVFAGAALPLFALLLRHVGL